MSLRLNRSEPLFRTIIELPGIGRRPRTRIIYDYIETYHLVSWSYGKSQHKILFFRILIAMNLNFYLQT